MGSISRTNRCDRFIKEFNGDVGLTDYGDLPSFHSQHLSMRDSDECVYLYVTLSWRSGSHELMEDTIYYCPEESEADALVRVVDLLRLEEEEAKHRLKRAGLLDPPENETVQEEADRETDCEP